MRLEHTLLTGVCFVVTSFDRASRQMKVLLV
jgi:hypothetical protein